MKLVRILIAAAALTAVLAGCKKDELTEGKKPSEGLTVNAAVDGTVVTAWKASDKMTVVCGEETYEYVTTQSGANAAFTDKNGILTADMVGDNPVSAFVNCRTMFGAFNIAPEQTYSDGASSVAIPMYAYTMNAPQKDALSLQFNALASIINLAIAPYDITVQSLRIKAAEGATIASGALAGAFKVDADNGTISVTTGQNELTVTFAGGLNLSQGATICIPVGLCSVAGGLELIFSYDDVKEYVGTILASDSAVKLYDDATGFKKAAKIDAAFEFDANAFPRTWYVAPDGTADAAGITAEAPTSLSNALSSALAGSVIKLAAGTYYPDTVYPGAEGDMFKTFAVTRNVTLEGADGAVLDGNGTSLHTMVVYAPKIEGEKTVLKNITVQNGASREGDTENVLILATNEDGSTVSLDGSYGAGISIVNSDIELEMVVVTGNKGFNGSGLFAKGSDIVIRNSVFNANQSGSNGAGLWFSAGNDLLMDGCTVSNNVAGKAAAGLYLHAPLETALNAEIRNTVIRGNKTASDQNAGGVYVRDDSGNHGLSFLFDGCTIEDNEAKMGASVAVLHGKGTFRNCVIKDNAASGNGNFYINTTADSTTDLIIDGCEFRDNSASGMAAGCYVFTTGGDSDVCVLNTLFAGNQTDGRGGAFNIRTDSTTGSEVAVKCVNCTFTENVCGSWGSAANLYVKNAGKASASLDLISCTVTGNEGTNSKYAGAVSCETASTTVNLYNSIVSGNTNNGNAADAAIKSGVSATMTFNCCLSGAEYYGADGAVVSVTPAFDYSTMLGALNVDGVCPLAGNDSTNPAFVNGMAAADLQALASGSMTADVLGSDQLGNARTGKVMGAYVK